MTSTAPTPAQLDHMAEVFSCLGDPTRLALLQALRSGERSVGELVAAVPVKQAAVSKQLRLLHDGGLVSRRRDGHRVLYAIADPVINRLCDLVCARAPTRHTLATAATPSRRRKTGDPQA